VFCLLASLVLAALLAAAPVPKGKPADYFPLKVGHKWEYVCTDGKPSHVEEVTAVEEKDGAKMFTVTRTRDGQEATTSVYRVDADGVARAKVGPLDYDPPLPLLKPVPKADDSWRAKTKIRAAEYEFEITVGKAEEVKVPAGTFTAYPVRHFNTSVRQAAPLVYWYAPDVGLIRSGSGQLLTELKAFTPAKEKK
jgi:hypothetical protein